MTIERSWLQGDLIAVVRRELDRRGWTQARLATEAGLTEKHVSQLLNGHIEGSISAWAAMLEAALNVGIGGYPLADVVACRNPPR